jgi:hypothetical protein
MENQAVVAVKPNALDTIRAAQKAATQIIAKFAQTVSDAPDVVAARKAELVGLKRDQLIDMIVKLEAPKAEITVKVEEIVKSLLEEPACACLTYEQLAGLITAEFVDRNTSGKSVASYASKKKEAWHIVPRAKVKLDMASLLALPQAVAVNG